MALTSKAVIVKDGKVLILKRAKQEKTNQGKWDLPGGHIEKGEPVLESLKREVLEETGLKIKVIDLLTFSEFPKEAKAFKQEKRGLRFLAEHVSGEVKLIKEEHSDFKWLKFEEAIEKLDQKDGFEAEKRRVLIKAQQVLEEKSALEGWKRALADFENYKKRQLKSNDDFRKFANEDFALDILPVLDNFEAATEHVPADQTKEAWVQGVMFIQKQLKDALANRGIEELKVKVGDKVDESLHEVVKGEAKGNSPRVKKIINKGYKIADRVIRPARVEV